MTTSEERAASGVLPNVGAFRSGWLAVVCLGRVLAIVARAFDHRLIRRLKGWVRLARNMPELADMSDRELRDLGINRVVIAAIRAGTYRHGSTDDGKGIVFCPQRGELVKLVLKERGSRSLTEDWMISGAPLGWIAARLVLAATVDPDLIRRPVVHECTRVHAGGVARAGLAAERVGIGLSLDAST
jgi:uncharacterized protein YjiS (DUF1127 family)